MRHLLTDLRGNPIYSAHRRWRRTRTSAASTLLLQVQNRAWNAVIRRVEKHPDEIWVVDENGNTPLHVAARHDPPPEVVQALQQVTRVANHDGITPLHVAASHRCSATTLQTLIDCGKAQQENLDGQVAAAAASPQKSTDFSISQSSSSSPMTDLSRMGRAPFHYACLSFRGLDVEAFAVLLDATLKDGFVVLKQNEEPAELSDFEECYDEELIDDDDDVDAADYFDLKPSAVDNSSGSSSGCSSGKSQKEPLVINVMSMKDGTGQTPLGLLFKRYRERVRCVISTVEQLRREHPDRPNQAAIGAALAVHDDLGDLWQKARWIVARLTEERLLREQRDSHDNDVNSFANKNRNNGGRFRLDLPPSSPGEAEVAQEAAQFSLEQHHRAYLEDEVVPLIAPTNNTAALDNDTASIPLGSMNTTKIDGSTAARSNTTERKFRIVHASVGLTGYGCPPEMVRLAMSMYPHQVYEMDEAGCLPIHIAVTATSNNSAPAFEGNHHHMFGGGELSDDHSVVSGMSFFSSATVSQTTNPFDKVIKILLQQYPEAVRVPHGKSGRLPLVIAIESGLRTWEDGIRSLLNAYPPALHDKKLIEPALFPNVLGLTSASSTARGLFTMMPHGNSDFFLHDLVVGTSGRRTNHNSNHKTTTGNSTYNSKIKRRDDCARTTLFQLIRTKPEWLVPESIMVASPQEQEPIEAAVASSPKSN